MTRTTLLLAVTSLALLLAGCAGPPEQQSTHTQEPEAPGVIDPGGGCFDEGDASGAGEERIAGDPIGDVGTREGGPATGDGDDDVPPGCDPPEDGPGTPAHDGLTT